MEEEPEDTTMMNLIETLHQVHCDNSQYQYYAELPGGRRRKSMMPITSFIHEFFLFNGLYQIDWKNSQEQCRLVYHQEGIREKEKREPLISFVQDHARKKPEDFHRAFEPVLSHERTEGNWTRVLADARVSDSDGKAFFKGIRDLQDVLVSCKLPQEDVPSNETLSILKHGAAFVTNVRNNIFHGSKSLADVHGDQAKRIEVYDLFLSAITSLFFLAMGKDRAACDYVTCPVSSASLPTLGAEPVIHLRDIFDATHLGFMKVGDSRLIARFTRVAPPPSAAEHPGSKTALFYPSAGSDIFTPLVLGLPYCRQFYFYDEARRRPQIPPSRDSVIALLNKIRGVAHGDIQRKSSSNRVSYDFEFNGTLRSVHLVRDDNRAFLSEDVELAFYFHRGDSQGEGGADQPWDSKWLPEMLCKIPCHSSCLYLTDGVPNGFDASYSAEEFELKVPFIERERRYYSGRFSPT